MRRSISSNALSFGPFRLDLSAELLSLDEQSVHLTPKSLALLRLLASRAGELVSKVEIFAALWPDTAVTDDALSRCIRELRAALGDDARRPRFLETVHRRGFRFIAPVIRPVAEVETPLPIIGRERELAAAQAWLEGIARGPIRMLRISGEPGVGKTRLAREIALRAARAGFTTLWSETPGDEGAPPFAIWRQLLENRALADPAAAARGRPSLGPRDGQQRVFRAVLHELEAMAQQRRVLLVLDDLHGADRDSLLVLDHLLQEAESSRLAIVCTYRDVGSRENAALRSLLDAANGSEHASIALRGLSQEAVALLLALRIGAERAHQVASSAHEKSGGNPMFLNELAELVPAEPGAAFPSGVPETIRQLIARRLDAVSPLCVELLTVAAVAGSDVPLALIRAASEIGVDALGEGIDEAIAQRLMARSEQSGSRVRFSHGLVREVVYERARPGLRARLHRRVARTLEQGASHDPGDALPALAHHFGRAVLGGDTEKAIHYALRAGERALAQFAFEEAADHYGAALDSIEAEDPVDLARACQAAMACARAHSLCGRRTEALATASRAVEYARRSRSSRLFREAVVVFSDLQPSYARDPREIALVDEALSRAEERDLATRSRLLSLRGLIAYVAADIRAHDGVSRDALELARRSEDRGALLEALRVRSLALNHPASEAEWRACYEERIALAASSGDAIHAFEGLRHRLEHRMQVGDVAGRDADLRAMDEIAARVRSSSMATSLLRIRAGLAISSGPPADARQLAVAALAAGRRVDPEESWAIAQLQLGTILGLEDQPMQAISGVHQGVVTLPQISMFHAAEIMLLIHAGAEEEARSRLLAMTRDRLSVMPRDVSYSLTLANLAQSCQMLGCGEAARPLYDALLPYAGRSVTLMCFYSAGCGSRHLGSLASQLSRWDEADAHFEIALAVDRKNGARVCEAQAALDYARSLLARGACASSARARELARNALAISDELAIHSVARAARALLEVT
jgi:DNA-binding winged helix-turn-helix (wHTH) protein/tetratricopeptide (TPR) repeat protein